MTVKAMLMNDPLPLRLGARLTMRPEEMRRAWREPEPVDIDLTVKWVGDVLDEEVQTSDLNHPSMPLMSAKLEAQLFGSIDPRVDTSYAIMGVGGYSREAYEHWMQGRRGPIGPRMIYGDPKLLGSPDEWLRGEFELNTASGLQLLMQAEAAEMARLGRDLASNRALTSAPHETTLCSCQHCADKRWAERKKVTANGDYAGWAADD